MGGNAFTFLKRTIPRLNLDKNPEVIHPLIDNYIQERITFAETLIAEYASAKIQNNDVILIYGYSETIDVVLSHAESSDTTFRVIIVDSRPLYEGKKHLEKLLHYDRIECTYILYNALSYVIMNQVTKVFLGAAGLMSDGCVLSRVGTAGVALLAHSYNIPVLFCCETYKISYRVQLDSFTENELGDPHMICYEDQEEKKRK